jgi:hypothetical protein
MIGHSAVGHPALAAGEMAGAKAGIRAMATAQATTGHLLHPRRHHRHRRPPHHHRARAAAPAARPQRPRPAAAGTVYGSGGGQVYGRPRGHDPDESEPPRRGGYGHDNIDH